MAVTCPSSSEAIDALLGTKRGSPRVVPDETKLPVTDRASRGFVRPETFRAVGHCCLPWWLFVDHPFSHRTSGACAHFRCCSLRLSQAATQLGVGRRRASKGITERYEGLSLGFRSQRSAGTPATTFGPTAVLRREPKTASASGQFCQDKPNFTEHGQCTGGIF